MGTKGMPFGYLEFSRAISGKPCSHARAPALMVRVRVPYPIWFFLNRVSRSAANRYNGFCDFCLEQSVATVQTEPLQPFRQICPSRSAIN